MNNWANNFLRQPPFMAGPLYLKFIAENMAARILNNDLHLFVKAVIVKAIRSEHWSPGGQSVSWPIWIYSLYWTQTGAFFRYRPTRPQTCQIEKMGR